MSLQVNSNTIPLTYETLELRLAIGATSQNGARASITRCAVKLGQHVHNDNNDSDEDTKNSSILRELELAHLEMNKLYYMIHRHNHQDMKQLDDLMHADDDADDTSETTTATTTREVVAALQKQLASMKSQQSCLEEYETLAKLAVSRHSVPRKTLQQQMDAVQQELDATSSSLRTLDGEHGVRRSQFQLLMQSMLDLKQSLGEPLQLTEEERLGNAENAQGGDAMGMDDQAVAGSTAADAGANSGDDAQEMDEDDGALYNDLCM
jgi:hypothetical protein